jgi:hypothetical protein
LPDGTADVRPAGAAAVRAAAPTGAIQDAQPPTGTYTDTDAHADSDPHQRRDQHVAVHSFRRLGDLDERRDQHTAVQAARYR